MNDNKLENWRKQIDAIDEKILELLSKRMSIVGRIGKYKKAQKLSAFDETRWKKILQSSLLKAQQLKLSKEFVKNILNLIHKYSLIIQKNEKS